MSMGIVGYGACYAEEGSHPATTFVQAFPFSTSKEGQKLVFHKETVE